MSLEKGIDRIGIAIGKVSGWFFGVCLGILALAWGYENERIFLDWFLDLCCGDKRIDLFIEFSSIGGLQRFFKSLIITLISPLLGFIIGFSLVSLFCEWITKKIIWIIEGFKE